MKPTPALCFTTGVFNVMTVLSPQHGLSLMFIAIVAAVCLGVAFHALLTAIEKAGRK